jgi:nucleoid-associated protein YgaU
MLSARNASATAAPHAGGAATTPAPPSNGPTPARAPAPTAPAAESTIVVAAGQSLSTVCQSRYGTSRPDVVQALARYNGLKDANTVRAGDTLRVPTLEQLMATSR